MNGILHGSVLRKALIGAVAVGALVAVTAAPALAAEIHNGVVSSAVVTADPASSLAAIQADAVVKITKRTTSLTRSVGRVTANEYLTDADRATILARLNADLAGLQALGAKIAADTDRAVAAQDFATIFTTYRVYAVVLPQSHYAAAADALTGSVIPHLNAAHQRLAQALASSPKSTPELEAKLQHMQGRIDAATKAITGVGGRALAITPAQYNANHAVLAPIRASIVTARDAARSARDDAREIVMALR
jgi:hypothetical protein